MNDPIDNMQHYKWDTFYYNPNDRRIIVSKRERSLGWTLNFARKESYLVIIILLAAVYLLGQLFF
jgi:uncharacterized membrane protein